MYKRIILLIVCIASIPSNVFAGMCGDLSDELEGLKEEHLALEGELLALNQQYYEDVEAAENRTVSVLTIEGAIIKIFSEYESSFGKTQAKLDVVKFEMENLIPELEACSEQEFATEMARIAEEEENILQEAKDKRLAEDRELAVEQALQNCNITFFDTMTNDEKMGTYDERQTCLNTSKAEDKQETFTMSPEAAQPTQKPVQMVTPSQQTYTDPAIDNTLVEPISVPNTIEEFDGSTSSEQAVIASPEELEPLIEEKQTESPTKQGFFTKVWSFLFGWF